MRVRYIASACVVVEHAGTHVLFGPWLTDIVSLSMVAQLNGPRLERSVSLSYGSIWTTCS